MSLSILRDLPTEKPGPTGWRVLEFKRFERNTLRGFLSLELPSGMVIHNCALHVERGRESSRWVSLPARPFGKPDGGKGWSALIEFNSKASKDRFQAGALAAVDEFMRRSQ
jgi:hypothetical protein